MKGTFLPRKLYEPEGLAYIYTGGKCNRLAPHLAGLESGHRGNYPRRQHETLESHKISF